MRTIQLLLQKEFLQIIRNKAMLPIIFVMPIMQTMILAFAANYEINNLRLHIVDRDRSAFSRQLTQQLDASERFVVVYYDNAAHLAAQHMQADETDMTIEIPVGFEKDLVSLQNTQVYLGANAINSVKAGVGMNYAASIIADYNTNIRLRSMPIVPAVQTGFLEIAPTEWFNPSRSYKNFFVPGILAVLITVIGSMLASLNIVRERELGTIEQLNVTPIHRYQFIIGKLIPFWIIGLFDLALGLGFAKLVFGLPTAGNMLALFSFAGLFLLAILGFGLFLSTFSETQQQAMFISWFFMLVFLLMGGVFTPIESMPQWAQVLTWLNPVSYMVQVLRLVLLKGSGFTDLWPFFFKMTGFVIALNAFAMLNYRKTT
ncbi:MAG: ABC transporter permease [Bacteroidetes Order II. Incertae sedis bacterium]|nr:ABC transporter permease [Bacteroidetes Order II. bacterium]